jgi:AAA domain-containing protein
MSNVPSTRDIDLGERIMALFIGGNGEGKSVAAASFPKPIRFWDFDGRMKPIKLFYPNDDISYVTVGPKAIPSKGIIDFLQFCKEFEDLQDRCPWATGVIDSFTNLSNTAITYQLRVRGGFDDFKGKKTLSGLPIPGFDEYNGETTSISQILDVAKVIPCNMIMTAHPIMKIMDEGGKSKRYSTIASYGSKIASIAPTYFDEIWAFEREGESLDSKRLVWTGGRNMTKTALPVPGVFDITGKRLYPLIKAAIEAHGIKLAEKARDAEVKEVEQPL